MPVASAEAPILAMLLPSSSAPISRSRISIRLETTASASLLPCVDSRSMLAREAPVSAVSLAAKNPDAPSSATMMEKVNQFMTRSSLLYLRKHISFTTRQNAGPVDALSPELALQEIAHPGGLHILCDHRAADRLQQNEGELAT